MTLAPDKRAVTARVKQCALAAGFDLVRITSADEFAADRDIALQRIQEGLMDGLPWYHANRVNRGASPQQLLPGAKSIICLALNYFPPDPADSESPNPELTGRDPAHPEPVEGPALGKPAHPEPVEGPANRDPAHPEPVEGPANRDPAHPEPVEGPTNRNPAHPEPVEGPANRDPAHPEPVEGPANRDPAHPEPVEGPTNRNPAHPEPVEGPTGKIARYARGRDYHRVMKRKMRSLVAELSLQLDTDIAARWYVDDGPMLDRAAAARAGLGWFGKNTNLLTSQLGSWVFLGQIITNLALTPDPTLQKTCGSCVRCIDACPTGAIVAPYVVDNTRCISYLTIENRGPIPPELRPQILDWVFGCDICQEVCPVNRKAQPTTEPAFNRAGLSMVDLVELLEMDEAEFRQRFAGTPVMRAKRIGLQRNACVALGNAANPDAVPALARALATAEPLVKRHAAWALGQIGGEEAIARLEQARNNEEHSEVLSEIAAALIRAAN